MPENIQIIRLLSEATHEVRCLRRRNEILEAKVGVMDLFAQTLNTQPFYHSNPMSEDVVWKMEKEIERLKSPEDCPDTNRPEDG